MIKVEKIIPGGQGLGTDTNGKKIFFWNALPEEIVEEYKITKQKTHYEEAIATKINNPSKYRISPKDSCFLSTSPWQIINYDYELKLKQELVVEIFREHHIEIPLPEIFTDYKDFYYRNKMEYSLYWNNEKHEIELAFHERGTHRKIPIKNSSIEKPKIINYAQNIVKELNERNEEARKYQSLLLRCNQKGEISGGLYENHKPHPSFKNLTDIILNKTYSYSPNGFFQVNLPVYELALGEIKKHIKTRKVLDLYSGVGTIGLSVAREKDLTLVEVDKYAYRELCKNVEEVKYSASLLSENAEKIKNLNPILAKSEEALNYIESDQTVILDPPRAGCDEKLIEKLLETTPEKIIYLSCNPSTQARDIKLLSEKYQIEETKIYNFFPHTPHIENLVILKPIF